jgi:hypothetical protein
VLIKNFCNRTALPAMPGPRHTRRGRLRAVAAVGPLTGEEQVESQGVAAPMQSPLAPPMQNSLVPPVQSRLQGSEQNRVSAESRGAVDGIESAEELSAPDAEELTAPDAERFSYPHAEPLRAPVQNRRVNPVQSRCDKEDPIKKNPVKKKIRIARSMQKTGKTKTRQPSTRLMSRGSFWIIPAS